MVVTNWNIIEAFLENLESQEDPGSDLRTVEQRHALSEYLPLVRVLENLLVPMRFSWRDGPNFSAVELAIQWQLKSNPMQLRLSIAWLLSALHFQAAESVVGLSMTMVGS